MEGARFGEAEIAAISPTLRVLPREVEFIEKLPKTPSGKLQRFILRSAEKPVGRVQ